MIEIRNLKLYFPLLNFNEIVTLFSFTEVQAAAPLEPKKPKEMRFQELPIYEQPFADYYDYQNVPMRRRCSKVRPIYDKLFPHVHNTRKQIQDQAVSLQTGFKDKILNICTCDLQKQFSKFRTYLTDPENITVRQGIVTSLILGGFHFGNRQNYLTKKLFFATVGALFGGCLCFPTETDKLVRQFTYTAITNLSNLLNYNTKSKTRPCDNRSIKNDCK